MHSQRVRSKGNSRMYTSVALLKPNGKRLLPYLHPLNPFFLCFTPPPIYLLHTAISHCSSIPFSLEQRKYQLSYVLRYLNVFDSHVRTATASCVKILELVRYILASIKLTSFRSLWAQPNTHRSRRTRNGLCRWRKNRKCVQRQVL